MGEGHKDCACIRNSWARAPLSVSRAASSSDNVDQLSPHVELYTFAHVITICGPRESRGPQLYYGFTDFRAGAIGIAEILEVALMRPMHGNL